MTYLFLSYFVIYIGYSVAILYLIHKKFNRKSVIGLPTPLPQISILIAARNEEDNILNCLESLFLLDYPADRIQILVGNDQSTDTTAEIVAKYIADKPNFKLINILEKLGNADAKANVLAHLAREATGLYLLITDADIEVPKSWAKTLLSYTNDSVAIVSGSTAIKGSSLFSKLQNIEWLYGFGMIGAVKEIDIPVTAVGNNMLISKEAYLSVGGYEQIPFSITEDYQLFKEVLKNGYDFDNILDSDAVAFSTPMSSFKQLFQQRKRWMNGAIQTPIILRMYLFFQTIFFPAIIAGLLVLPVSTIIFFVLNSIILFILLKMILNKSINQKLSVRLFLLYQLYAAFTGLGTVIYYFTPTKVSWKQRKY